MHGEKVYRFLLRVLGVLCGERCFGFFAQYFNSDELINPGHAGRKTLHVPLLFSTLAQLLLPGFAPRGAFILMCFVQFVCVGLCPRYFYSVFSAPQWF